MSAGGKKNPEKSGKEKRRLRSGKRGREHAGASPERGPYIILCGRKADRDAGALPVGWRRAFRKKADRVPGGGGRGTWPGPETERFPGKLSGHPEERVEKQVNSGKRLKKTAKSG